VTPFVSPNVEHVYHLYAVQAPNRDHVRRALSAEGIETGIHYPIPLHQQPAYAHLGYQPGDYPISAFLGPRILSLPMFPEISENQIEAVVDALRRALT
jgi:dTDP-4-amino-4,6-dideoxygalactose transaminase